MLFTASAKLDLLGIIAAFLIILFIWHLWSLSYWKRKGVYGPKPLIFFGNAKMFFLQKKTWGEYWRDLYLKYRVKQFIGVYITGQPIFFPTNINLIKSIMQTDFQCFHSHGLYYDKINDPLSGNLFYLDGSKWKEIRTKLTPTFTSGKLKMMHQNLIECSKVLEEILSDQYQHGPLEIKNIMARFTIDNIGSCAFGLDINSLNNPDAEFKTYGDQVLELDFLDFVRFISSTFVNHDFLRLIKFKSLKPNITQFFYDTVRSTIKYREANNVVRKDFLNLLLQMKKSNDRKEKLSINEIAAQCFIFFLAGYESSSTTMSFACYELAVNQDIQHKVREEINRVFKKNNDKLTYEGIVEMEYLDQVVHETLRKYPPLPVTTRKCTKTYKIPGESVEIDEGTIAMISILGIHNDPEYYPNPENFDPERFSEQNRKTRPQFAYIPFGEGPRICIGMRFGIHQVKIGLAILLKSYKIFLNNKTITPLKYRTIMSTACIGGIWLDLEKV